MKLTPSRLAVARQRRRMSYVGLAELLNVTPRTVARWEKGEVSPDESMVLQLAAILDFPEAFLYGDDIDELPADAVSFRARTKTSAALKSSAISAGRMATKISTWLDENFRLPEPNVPTLAGYPPELAAETLRARWGLGNSPIASMTDLLEANGVRVFSLAMDVQEVDAFSFYRNRRPFVLVNTNKTGERQRFDLAHELAHLVIHCEHEKVNSSREAEHQANQFASAFLMPREDLIALPLWYADVGRIIKAKQRWKVSAMALTHRLRNLEMLTDWGYRDACVLLSQAGYRRGEPSGAITPETSQVLGKVFASIRARDGSLLVMAEALGVDIEEFNSFVFGLAPIALPGLGKGGTPTGRLRLVQDLLSSEH